MIGGIFAQVLRMSLIGCYTILVVLLARWLLVRCERKYSYYLWIVVFINLCVPISLQGFFSLIPRQLAEFSLPPSLVEEQEMIAALPSIQLEDKGWEAGKTEEAPEQIVSAENNIEIIEKESIDSVEKGMLRGWYLPIVQTIWLLGVLLLGIWNLVEAGMLSRRLHHTARTSEDSHSQVVEILGLPTPFLWGMFRPVIYLPAGLTEQEREYVLLHERYHQKRRDYLIKPLLLLVTILHWFNPLVWLAYNLCCKDMEISCDEAVLAQLQEPVKKAYAGSILRFAAGQNGYLVRPLTFGEPSVKSRIQHVLQYKRERKFSKVAAIISIGILFTGLLMRPLKEVKGADLSLEETPLWTTEPIVGTPCKLKESGWNVEEAIDLTETEEFRRYFQEVHTEQAEETYLLSKTEHFTLYGSGDRETMLLERNQFYAQIEYPYLSYNKTPPVLLERDFDGDGIEELAILLKIKYGGGRLVDTLLLADLQTGTGWFVTQLLEEQMTEPLMERLTYERTEQGLQAYVNGEKAGEPFEDREGFAPWQAVRVGDILKFSYGEEGRIYLEAELMYYHNQYPTQPVHSGTYMTAEVVWYHDFRLKNITFVKP